MSKLTTVPSSRPYPFPAPPSTFSPSTTALILIDLQNDFLSPQGYLSHISPDSLQRFAPLIPRLQSLLTSFRNAKFLVVHTREGHEPHMATVSPRELHRSALAGAKIGSQGPLGRLLIRGEQGHEIIDELRPLDGEVVIDKPGRGAFTNTELDGVLRAAGIRNVVIGGVTADACVSSTIREASDRGYDVCVLEDGVESMSEELKTWTLESVRIEGGLFGVTATCEEVQSVVDSWTE